MVLAHDDSFPSLLAWTSTANLPDPCYKIIGVIVLYDVKHRGIVHTVLQYDVEALTLRVIVGHVYCPVVNHELFVT